jgi:hypothetical protein
VCLQGKDETDHTDYFVSSGSGRSWRRLRNLSQWKWLRLPVRLIAHVEFAKVASRSVQVSFVVGGTKAAIKADAILVGRHSFTDIVSSAALHTDPKARPSIAFQNNSAIRMAHRKE